MDLGSLALTLMNALLSWVLISKFMMRSFCKLVLGGLKGFKHKDCKCAQLEILQHDFVNKRIGDITVVTFITRTLSETLSDRVLQPVAGLVLCFLDGVITGYIYTCTLVCILVVMSEAELLMMDLELIDLSLLTLLRTFNWFLTVRAVKMRNVS